MKFDLSKAAGVDVGYHDTVVLSTGERLNGPLHEIVRSIVDRYVVICTETLSPEHKYLCLVLAKLKVSCQRRKRIHVAVSRYYASTRTCSTCQGLTGPTTTRIRVWQCSGCMVIHDRDVNAAKNLLREGVRLLSQKLVA